MTGIAVRVRGLGDSGLINLPAPALLLSRAVRLIEMISAAFTSSIFLMKSRWLRRTAARSPCAARRGSGNSVITTRPSTWAGVSAAIWAESLKSTLTSAAPASLTARSEPSVTCFFGMVMASAPS